MTSKRLLALLCAGWLVAACCGPAGAQTISVTEKWVTVKATAAGTDDKAKEQAVAKALRTAVEQTCGVIVQSYSKVDNFKHAWDTVLTDAAGYIAEYKVISVKIVQDTTVVRVSALVTTQAVKVNLKYLLDRVNDPRVMVVIVEATYHRDSGPTYRVDKHGAVQGKIEDYFLNQGVALVDITQMDKLAQRNVKLAAVKGDAKALAAYGTQFKADIVVTGRATAKFGRTIQLAGQTLHQFNATLNARVVQCDTGRVLASKSFGPMTSNSLQRLGGEDKALAKLGKTCGKRLVGAMKEVWLKHAYDARPITVNIAGMDYETWMKKFVPEVQRLIGVKGLHHRQTTEGITSADMYYRYSTSSLAKDLMGLKNVKLKITEVTTNSMKLKVVE